MSLAFRRVAGRLAPALALLSTLAACSADAPLAPTGAPDAALAHEGINTRAPFFGSEFVPCANGGEGEWVTIEGVMHEQWTFHTDAAGNAHASAHMNPQGLSGVGETTGDRYNAVGNYRAVFNYDDARSVGGVQNRTTFVGRGNGVRFEMILRYHEVQRPDGSWAVVRDGQSIRCSE